MCGRITGHTHLTSPSSPWWRTPFGQILYRRLPRGARTSLERVVVAPSQRVLPHCPSDFGALVGRACACGRCGGEWEDGFLEGRDQKQGHVLVLGTLLWRIWHLFSEALSTWELVIEVSWGLYLSQGFPAMAPLVKWGNGVFLSLASFPWVFLNLELKVSLVPQSVGKQALHSWLVMI